VIGGEVLELLARRPDEHVAHEQGVVGARTDHAHADPVLLIPSRIAVDDIDAIPRVEVVDGSLAVDSPHLESRASVSVGQALSGRKQTGRKAAGCYRRKPGVCRESHENPPALIGCGRESWRHLQPGTASLDPCLRTQKWKLP